VQTRVGKNVRGCASSSRTEHKRLRLSQACAADAAVKVDQGSREWLSLFHT
jgi:hypothetical protein